MKNHLYLSDEDQNGVPRSACCWWRTGEEFDENGHLKMEISCLSNSIPRLKILREMERLAMIATEGLDELRHKLLSYRAGDFWLPIGGIKKEEIAIPPVITILLTGVTGSGKSSLVNMMYSVLGRCGLIPFAQTSGEASDYSTMYLEEHNVLRSPRSGFCVYDTMGLDNNHMDDGLAEVSTWVCDGVRHNQPCYRYRTGDEKLHRGRGSTTGPSNSSRYVKRKVNSVMVVADLSQIHKSFQCGDLKSMETLKQLFISLAMKNSNDNPLLILTHGDTLNAEERINGRLKVCEYLGIPVTTGAYDIPCLTEQGILADESDPVTAFALTEAVYRSLLQADRAHLPKRKLKDWIIFFLYCVMWCIASIFEFLADLFSRFGHHKNKFKT